MIKLRNTQLLHTARNLPSSGKLLLSDTDLTYLRISDDYIHQLFPLLENSNIQKPDYFVKYPIGAHITVFYPDENVIINPEDLNQSHNFIVKDLVKMEIGPKTYYALKVEAPSLVALRNKYGLTEKLNFRGHTVDLHITIGVDEPHKYMPLIIS